MTLGVPAPDQLDIVNLIRLFALAVPPGRAACGVRDHRADYEAAGAVVLGISRDPVERLAQWDAEPKLGFPLLSDADHAVAEAYGVWVEKSMYGRRYMGTQRATFVVDAGGVVAHVIPKASPKTHDGQVLAALERVEAS